MPSMIDAGSYRVGEPFLQFANENRVRFNQSILEEDHDLQRRIQQGKDNYDSSDSDNNEEYYAAEDELYTRSQKMMRKEYEENVSEAEKERFHQMAVEWRNNIWRRHRTSNRLSETEESLKQKEEDEKNGITGAIPLQRACGASQGAAASQNQVTGTFVGGEILTPVQVLTPPFDRNSLKMKTGKIEPEEYF